MMLIKNPIIIFYGKNNSENKNNNYFENSFNKLSDTDGRSSNNKKQ